MEKILLFPAHSLSCISYLTFSSTVTTLFHFLLISLCYAILYCSQLPLFSYVAVAGPITRPIPIFLYVSPDHPPPIQHGPSSSFLPLVFLPSTENMNPLSHNHVWLLHFGFPKSTPDNSSQIQNNP